jgi:hypothetical protein
MPARSHDARLVRRQLRLCSRGGQSGVDDLGEVGGSQKDSTFAAAKGIHQKVVAGACQLNPFPPSLPTHAGARANLAAKRSPSIHLGHPRPPWPVPPISACIYRLSDVIRLAFVMVGRPFGHYSLVLVLPYLFPIALSGNYVANLEKVLQSFLWRRFNPTSINIATNPSR